MPVLSDSTDFDTWPPRITPLRKSDRLATQTPVLRQRCLSFPPIDTPSPAAHVFPVEKQPHKVEEPQALYRTKQPAKPAPAPQPGPRYASLDKVRATNAKLIQVHHKVLQKLAQ